MDLYVLIAFFFKTYTFRKIFHVCDRTQNTGFMYYDSLLASKLKVLVVSKLSARSCFYSLLFSKVWCLHFIQNIWHFFDLVHAKQQCTVLISYVLCGRVLVTIRKL